MRVDFASSWDTNDADPQEEYRESTCNKKRLILIGLIILFLLSLGMLIAGSVMLGIGVHKSNETPPAPSCPIVAASPYYATLLSTQISYDDVQKNYTQAVAIVTAQIRNSLKGGSSNGKMMQLAATSNTDPLITILGLSPGDGNIGVMSVTAIVYTSQDSPTTDSVTTDLSNGKDLTLYHIEETQPSTSVDTQMCSIVSVYYNNTDTPQTPGPSTKTTVTQATTPTTKLLTTPTSTPQHCTCPPVPTCPTNAPATTPTTKPQPPSSSSSSSTKTTSPKPSPSTSTPQKTQSTSTSPKATSTTSKPPTSTTTVPPVTNSTTKAGKVTLESSSTTPFVGMNSTINPTSSTQHVPSTSTLLHTSTQAHSTSTKPATEAYKTTVTTDSTWTPTTNVPASSSTITKTAVTTGPATSTTVTSNPTTSNTVTQSIPNTSTTTVPVSSTTTTVTVTPTTKLGSSSTSFSAHSSSTTTQITSTAGISSTHTTDTLTTNPASTMELTTSVPLTTSHGPLSTVGSTRVSSTGTSTTVASTVTSTPTRSTVSTIDRATVTQAATTSNQTSKSTGHSTTVILTTSQAYTTSTSTVTSTQPKTTIPLSTSTISQSSTSTSSTAGPGSTSSGPITRVTVSPSTPPTSISSTVTLAPIHSTTPNISPTVTEHTFTSTTIIPVTSTSATNTPTTSTSTQTTTVTQKTTSPIVSSTVSSPITTIPSTQGVTSTQNVWTSIKTITDASPTVTSTVSSTHNTAKATLPTSSTNTQHSSTTQEATTTGFPTVQITSTSATQKITSPTVTSSVISTPSTIKSVSSTQHSSITQGATSTVTQNIPVTSTTVTLPTTPRTVTGTVPSSPSTAEAASSTKSTITSTQTVPSGTVTHTQNVPVTSTTAIHLTSTAPITSTVLSTPGSTKTPVPTSTTVQSTQHTVTQNVSVTSTTGSHQVISTLSTSTNPQTTSTINVDTSTPTPSTPHSSSPSVASSTRSQTATVTQTIPVTSTTVTQTAHTSPDTKSASTSTVTSKSPGTSTTTQTSTGTHGVTNTPTTVTQTASSAPITGPVGSSTVTQTAHTSLGTNPVLTSTVTMKTPGVTTQPSTGTHGVSSTPTTVTQTASSAPITGPATSTTVTPTPAHGAPTSTVVTVNTLASATPAVSTASSLTTNTVTQTARQSTVTPTVPVTTPTSTVTVRQTTPTTTVLPSCQPVTTPQVPIDENMKDIVVLIDDSTAVSTQDNYNQLKQWLVNQLFKTWPVSTTHWEVAPVQYAQYEYNILMDFDENNLNELTQAVSVSVYSGRNGPSITKGLRSTVGLNGRDYVPRTTILISASSNETDVLNSQSYAHQLNSNGGQVITLAVGGADGNFLAMLSAGPSHYFSTPNFTPSQQIADQITALIKGPEPATTQSTTSQPSTLTPIPDLPCHPDVAIIFDRSSAVPTNQEFQNQIDFIADDLTNSWNIQKAAMETELVVYSARSGGSLALGAYSYRSKAQFSSVVHNYNNYWDQSEPLISGALKYTSSVSSNRRDGRSVNTILFTYSSDYSDIANSLQYTANLGNLIVISLGKSSPDLLTALSGNVVHGMPYGADMVQQINTMICNPATAAPLPTTQTTPSIQTTPTTTTIQPTSHTVVTRKPCADCNPSIASIVVAVDAGGMLSKAQFASELSFVSGDLQNGWNHFERFGLVGFDVDSHTQVMASFGDIMTSDEYKILVNAIVLQSETPSIVSVMKQIVRNFSPNPIYGAMKTLLFTSTQDPTDITNALAYSKQLRSMGSVIIVGINMQNVSLLSTLTNSPDDVIAWPDISNDSGIAVKINQRLASSDSYTTASTQPYSTTVQAGPTSTQPSHISSTSGSTVTVGSTVTQPITSTRQPLTPTINCGRDLILLIDQSNAIPDQKSFDKLKNWLMNTLVPMWPVSPDQIAVAPFGFANKTWTDVGGDFTENSANEVNILLNYNLFYQPSKSQGLVRAIQRTSQLVLPRTGAAVIVISAYDNATDVTSASAFADSMKENGRIIITLGVGSAVTGNLKMLSSGPSYSFTSTFDFPSGDLLAQQISEQICNGSAPIIPTTQSTLRPSTQPVTTPLPTSFPCLPDAAILLDNSAEQTVAEFGFLVRYISSTLVSDWQISPNQSESALISADATIGIVASNPWIYQNLEEFQEVINAAEDDFYGGKSSITSLISYLKSNLPPKARPDRPLTAILFTHTSDLSDISNSVALLGTMPPLNLIAVGLGRQVDLINLQYLTGNAIVANTLDQNLKQQVDAMMCSETTPAVITTVTTVTPPKASTSIQPITSPQTTTNLPTSTVTLDKCYNCYPQEENILIMMDNSVQETKKYAQQQSLISQLISNWNHLERIAFGYYSSSLTQSIGYKDLRPDESPSVLQQVINAIGVSNKQANIQHSLYQAKSIIPLPEYGVQKTVFFTTTSDPAAINASLASANFLQSLGSLTVVGVALPAYEGINQLASPGMAISWNNLNNTQDVIGQIMNTLTSNITITTVTSLPTSTILTTPGSTQTTVTSATNCDRDVLLLVDQSNAVPDQASFDKLKSWLTTSLVPKWNVSPDEIAVAPFGFANKTWTDVGGDFEETSVAEVNLLVNNNLIYMASKGQGLVRALEKASQTSTPHGTPAVILISAYDNADDVTSAGQYAESLKANGATVITLAVGAKITGNLKNLASGDAFAFSSTDFAVSDALALQISEVMCSTVTRRPRTTTPMITTTPKPTSVMPTSFPCLPDAAVLLDNSGEQTEGEFANLVHYVSSTLVSDWQISPNQSEGALISANAYIGIVASNAWKYQNLADFQENINNSYDDYYGGKSSITALISYLNSNLPPTRPDRPLTAILFTYTSVMSDITNSLTLMGQMPSLNLIVVGLGQKVDLINLQYLSGNAIIVDALDVNLKQKIDSMMCNPTTPAVQTTTTKPATTTTASTSAPSTTPYQSTTAQPVTTVTLDKCANCYPKEENILVIMDNSAQQNATTYAQQQSLISQLISNWNHLERISFGYYSSSLTQSIGYKDLRSDEPVSILQTIINGTLKSAQNADIAHALYQATSIVPLPAYGIQKTVFFTTTSDSAAIQKSLNSAHFLQSLGSLTVVGVALPDSQGINQLASPGMAISWNNLENTQDVIGQIMETLTSDQSTVSPVTVPSTSSGTQTTQAAGTSVSTVTPVTNCDRDVILLIDQSNAIPDQNSFNQMITWITQNLTPKWPVSPNQIAVAPFGFANKTWSDVGGNFEENSAAEVNLLIKNGLFYLPNVGQGLTRALEKTSQTTTPHGAPAVILISAYDGAADVTASGQYSDSLKANGATVITLAVGPTNTGNLGKLSSGPAFNFTSKDFVMTDALAVQITKSICDSVTRKPTTTVPIVTTTIPQTTVLPTSFPCLPDTALLLDNSDLQTNQQFKDLVHYISSSLVSDWLISPTQSESALIVGNARFAEMISGGWSYPNLASFQQWINSADDELYGGSSSIYSLLSYYKSNSPTTRDGHPANAILFTYSSDLTDINKSIALLSQMDALNLMIVGLGGQVNADLLKTLSGNTVIANTLDTQLKNTIDSMMCNPTSPVPPVTVVTTTAMPAAPTSTFPAVSSIATSTVALTTVAPFSCTDCYPQEENILLIMDDSAGQDVFTFSQQKSLLSQLVSNWNHLERVSFGFYSNAFTDNVGYGNLLPSEKPALLQAIINSVSQSNKEADIAHALYQATSIVPLPTFGQQKTVFFTSTADPSDIQKSLNSSAFLQSLGSLIVVGVALPAGSDVTGLASPGMALAWNNVNDTQAITQQIMNTLGGSTPPTGVSSTIAPITSPASQTSNPTTNVPVCRRDIMMLMDESNSIPDDASFNKLKNWILNTLLKTFNLGPIQVMPVGYATKDWNDMLGGTYDGRYSDLNIVIKNMYNRLSSKAPNMTYALGKAPSALSQDNPTTVILISTSSDPTDIASATAASSALKTNGNDVITLGIGFTADKLQGISSGPGFSFASPSYDIDASVAQSINSVLCSNAPTPSAGPSTTPQPVPSTTAAPVVTSTVPISSTRQPRNTAAAVQTPTAQPLSTSGAPIPTTPSATTTQGFQTTTSHQCTRKVILLMDESKAVDNSDDFNKLSHWITSSLLPQLLPEGLITFLPIGYANNDFNDMMGGDFSGNLGELKTVITPAYMYRSMQTPNMTRALQRTLAFLPTDSETTVVLISASSDPTDVQSAVTAALPLKTNGNQLITMGIGFTADKLQTISSGPSFAFASPDYNFKLTLTQNIVNAVCPNGPVTTGPSPSTTPSIPTQSTSTPVCTRDVLLLLDQSNSIPDDASFNKLKNWILNTLLKTFNLGPIQVLPVGYANQNWNDLLGGTYDGLYVDLDTVITNVYTRLSNNAPNMTYALRKAPSTLSAHMPRTVILISTSSDPTDIAIAASSFIKANGNDLITLGIGFTADKLQAISSGPGFSFASPSYDIDATVAQSISSMLCSTAPTPSAGPSSTQQPLPSSSAAPPVSSTVQTVPPTSTAGQPSTTNAVITSTAGQPPSTSGAPVTTTPLATSTIGVQTTTSHQCTRKVILLMDDSNAVDTSDDFNKLSHWITSSLLPQLLPSGQISVLPIGYASKDFNDMMGGDFSSSLTELKTVITPSYAYQSNQTANMTRALQKTFGSMPVDSLTTVMLISASSDPTDVQTAVAAAIPLKTNGNQLITMGIGFTADKLQTISSGPSFDFTSPDFNFKLTLTQNIVNAVCPNGQATNSPSPSSTPNIVSQSTVAQTNAATSTATVTQSVTSQATVTQSVTSQATVTQPTTLQATVTQLATSPAIVTQPATSKATVTQPATSQATVTQPATPVVTVTQPPTSQATVTQPATPVVTVTQPPTSQATVTQPATPMVTVIQAATSQATVTPPATSQNTVTQPATSQTTVTQPATPQPPVTQPVSSKATVTPQTTSQATIPQSAPSTTGPQATSSAAPAATTQRASSAAPSSSAAPTSTARATTHVAAPSTTGIPTTSASPCARNIIILMDESNAVTNQNSFTQLQKWITGSLLANINLSVAKVLPIGYASQDWNNFMNSQYDSSISDLKNNITANYQYKSNNVPDMTNALEKAALEVRNGVPTTVLIISASNNAADIATATTAAMNLKSAGNDVITLGIAFGAEQLQPISSGVSFSFASPTYTIKLSVTQGIQDALCAIAPASIFSDWET